MQNNSSNLQLASMRSRALAYLIDDLLVTIIIMMIFWESISAVSEDMDAMMYLLNLTIVLYFAAAWLTRVLIWRSPP